MCKSLILAVVAAFSLSPVRAQQVDDRWEFDFAPYFWMADSSGNQTVRGINASVDLDFFDDVADNLDKGFQFHLEASKNRWTLIFDPTLLEVVTSQNVGIATFETRSKSAIVDMKVAYEFNGPLEVIWGLRYYESDLDIRTANLGPAISVSQDEDWWDLVAGVRYRFNAGQKWSLVAEGDLAGFDFSGSSDLAWNLSLAANYALTERYDLAFGYRILDIDYDRGGGARAFHYDIRSSGPMIGFNFNF